MAVNYIVYNTTLTAAELFAAIVAAADFWDETTSTTATVGGVTLTLASNSLTISGYGYTSSTVGSSNNYVVRIAATDSGIIWGWATSYNVGAPNFFAMIGKNADDEWAGAYSGASGYKTVSELIADGVTNKNFRPTGSTFVGQLSTVNTQLIDISAAYGDFTFSDIYMIVMSPAIDYVGKMVLNDEHYVQMGFLALKYTEE